MSHLLDGQEGRHGLPELRMEPILDGEDSPADYSDGNLIRRASAPPESSQYTRGILQNYTFNIGRSRSNLSAEKLEELSMPTSSPTGCRPQTPLSSPASPRELSVSQRFDAPTEKTFSWRTWVLIPESKRGFTISWIEIWSFAMTLCIFFVAFYVPFDLVLLRREGTVRFSVESGLDITFTIDIILQFFVAFPNRPWSLSAEMWEVSPHRIFKNYCAWPLSDHGRAGLFWPDIISVCPGFLSVASRLVFGDWYAISRRMRGLDKGLRAVRLLRLLHLYRLARLMERWQATLGYSYATVTFTKHLAVSIFVCHWMACVWIASEGRYTDGAILSYNTDQPTWLSALIEAKGDPCSGGVLESPWCIYVIALYWAVVTLVTVGYGDIVPQNLFEYFICTLSILISGYTWAYIVGSVVNLLSNLDGHNSKFKQNMDDLNLMMDNMALPRDLRIKLRTYMHEAQSVERLKAQKAMFEKNISLGLQLEVARFTSQDVLHSVYWTDALEEDMKAEIVHALRSEFFGPHEVLKKPSDMIIIRRGIAASRGVVLSRGDVWGHENILISNQNLWDRHFLRSLSFLDVLVLQQTDLRRIMGSSEPASLKHLQSVEKRIRIYRAIVITAQKRAIVNIFDKAASVKFSSGG